MLEFEFTLKVQLAGFVWVRRAKEGRERAKEERGEKKTHRYTQYEKERERQRQRRGWRGKKGGREVL